MGREDDVCRLAAAVGRARRELFEGLAGLSGQHPDGWGIVAWGAGGAQLYARQPVRADDAASRYRWALEAALDLAPAAAIAHLRKASAGGVRLENTHPFVDGAWAFAHNGTLRDIVPTGGRTDSETFFRERLLPRLGAGEEPVAALVTAARSVADYSALNVLLCDGARLYALERHTDREDYYRLLWRRAAGAVEVASRDVPAPAEGWAGLGNDRLLVVEGGEPRVVELG